MALTSVAFAGACTPTAATSSATSPSTVPPTSPVANSLTATAGPAYAFNREEPLGSGTFLWSTGDTYYTAWGSDGTLYMVNDDTKGFNSNLDNKAYSNSNAGRNLTVEKLIDRPDDVTFNGQQINGNHQSLGFFGGESEYVASAGGCDWKANGLGSYDGVLYLTVGDQGECVYHDGKARASAGSILKSTNSGVDWVTHYPSYSVNSVPPSPMFNDPHFSKISFVEYGQDGASPGAPSDSQNYVYAISNDGNWDNGDALYLGRVLRSQLANLNPADWQFYSGTTAAAPQWGTLANASPIFSKPGHVSQTAMYYNPAKQKYILPLWYYPRDTNPAPGSADYYGPVSSSHTIWEFYAADNPWGPWTPATPFFTADWPTQGYYNPTIPNKYVDGNKMWVLFTGDYNSSYVNWQTYNYSMHFLQITIE